MSVGTLVIHMQRDDDEAPSGGPGEVERVEPRPMRRA